MRDPSKSRSRGCFWSSSSGSATAWSSGVDAGAAAAGLIPHFEGSETVLLATGMLGATVMPHVIYLHGALTKDRYARSTEPERLAVLSSQRVDVVSAMAIAGLINIAMLCVAAQSLSSLPAPVQTIEGAYEGLAVTLGPTCALLSLLNPHSPTSVDLRQPKRSEMAEFASDVDRSPAGLSSQFTVLEQ